MSRMKWIAFVILLPVLLFVLYFIFMLIYGTVNDWKPEAITFVPSDNAVLESPEKDSTFTFLLWNIGYGGLGKNADFFYDAGGGTFTANGANVRSPQEEVDEYTAGIVKTLMQHASTDFLLLQEVDTHSKRSYFTNQFQLIGNQALPNHERSIALNYKAKFIPIPMLNTSPMGKVNSGVATYSKYPLYDGTRHQFPGNYGWPKRIFMLDRCFLIHRVPVAEDRSLIIVNSHNSAYDDGTLKQQQMDYLKSILQEEYQRGNYVVVGADWNQCPPGFAYDSFSKENADSYTQTNVPEDYLPEGWQWVFDASVATNRKLSTPYTAGETFTTLIDFYLVSPNVEVLEVNGIDLDFAYSDHQPVKMKVKLK